MKRFAIPARLLLPLGLGALATLALLALLWRLSGPPLARAAPGARYVAPAGLDAGNDCSDSSHPCATIQHAVDAAVPGDVVKIATGLYSDVHGRLVPPGYPSLPAGGIITQVVYLSKSLSLRGGYTVAFTEPPDPGANPTTLDARGEGRVLLITAPSATSALASTAERWTGQAISPTLEGLRITAGDADGLGGEDDADTAGGGVYVISATVMISDCHLFGNTALYGGGVYIVSATVTISDCHLSGNAAGYGGGLYLYASTAKLTGNTLSANTAGDGGGLYLCRTAATLSGNIVSANRAYYSGGGLYLDESPTTLISNTVSENYAFYFGRGGGLYLSSSPATLIDNTISFNDTGENGAGGGLYVIDSAVTLSANIISHNDADDGLGGGLYLGGSAAMLNDNHILHNDVAWGAGGGVALRSSDDVTLIGNTVSGNRGYSGGGLELYDSAATLISNTVAANYANDGGGLYLERSDATLTNNVVTDNRTETAGSGLYVRGSSPRLLHTTLARNRGGDGSGISVTDAGTYSAVALTNTILVSQAVGIRVRAGNTATLAGTLWGGGAWANGADWGGAGTILTGTINLWGDPGFLDPDSGDYHIGFGSAAIDAGLDAGVTTDIDGELRPAALGFDIGADENSGAILRLRKVVKPRVLNPSQILTYTLVVTSAGVEGATNVWLTDTLPALQQALAITTSRGSCALAGDAAASRESNGWGGTATCHLGTLAPGESARVTLTAQVTSTPPAELPWPMRNAVWAKAAETTTTTTQAETLLHDCHARLNDDPAEYSTVQAAVDASTRPGDLVKVAGYCTGVTRRAGVAQVVYLSKTLTLQGGWNTAFTERDVVRYPTTLDAWGQGRVLYIADPATGSAPASGAERWTAQAISPTVEGLRITGGDASGLGYGPDPGAGLYVVSAAARISDNLIFSNTADGHGGGLYLYASPAVLSANTISDNSASGGGGGLYLERSDATLTNNVVTDNQTRIAGSGVYVRGSSPRLLHTTLARNRGGDDSGIYVTDLMRTYSTVALTNTLLVSQALGIYVTAGNAARLEGTLWGDGAWANGSDWGGAGTILTGTVNLWGDPDFLDPDNGDYHVGPASAAIDAGVDAGVSIDVDGEPRPWGAGYDIGADECHCNQVPYLPSHPTPAHGATGVPLTQTLSWRGGDPDGDLVTYAIAFGTDDPPPLVATTLLTSYTPALVADTTYYWTVSASDGVSLSLGPLWRFTTRHTLYLPLLFHRFP